MITVPSPYVTVHFEHWRVDLENDWLIRYGSPHYESRAKSELFEICKIHAHRVTAIQKPLFIPRAQIILANEVFPEAAMADPLADLEIWDEWNSGTRAFPYPGQYSRLGLVTQQGKTSAPSSVGVLGEIMAGLFAQVYIAPWPLVRVVRYWPDFIFYDSREGRYSFVEAKASTSELGAGAGLAGRVSASHLGECAFYAVRQINSDPSVKVWGAFTTVTSISPFVLNVTFVEFDSDQGRRAPEPARLVPPAVVSGLANRALAMAAQALSPDYLVRLQNRRQPQREEAEQQLALVASKYVDRLLVNAGPEAAISNSRAAIDTEIRELAKTATVPQNGDGERFLESRRAAARGATAPIRAFGGQIINVRDLNHREIADIEQNWHASWERATECLATTDAPEAWRFGGSVYWLASPLAPANPRG